VGGDLSRVSRRRVAATQRHPWLNVLIQLSERKTLERAAIDALTTHGDEFVAHGNIGYVIIDRTRASPALTDFAVRALHLEELEADGPAVLYRPLALAAS
jgi:hypothetical protein